jgi:hypothetical protein
VWRDQFHAGHRCRPCCWPRGRRWAAFQAHPDCAALSGSQRAIRDPASHSPIVANLQLALRVAGQPGDERNVAHAMSNLWTLLNHLRWHRWPSLQRGNKAWGVQPVMARAEQRGLPYLFRLRTDAILDTMALAVGFPADVERLFPTPGISVAERYALLAPSAPSTSTSGIAHGARSWSTYAQWANHATGPFRPPVPAWVSNLST